MSRHASAVYWNETLSSVNSLWNTLSDSIHFSISFLDFDNCFLRYISTPFKQLYFKFFTLVLTCNKSSKYALVYQNLMSGREISVGHRTMSGKNGQMSGRNMFLLDMMSGRKIMLSRTTSSYLVATPFNTS